VVGGPYIRIAHPSGADVNAQLYGSTYAHPQRLYVVLPQL